MRGTKRRLGFGRGGGGGKKLADETGYYLFGLQIKIIKTKARKNGYKNGKKNLESEVQGGGGVQKTGRRTWEQKPLKGKEKKNNK